MANTRISDLTSSAANLAATDVTPVVQTTGVGPVKMTGLQFAGGLLGSTALTGATVTTSQPVLNLTQTWNAVGVTFTGLKFNATDTASASGSLLLDLQVGGTSKVNVRKDGAIIFASPLISSDTVLDFHVSSSATRTMRLSATGLNISGTNTNLSLNSNANLFWSSDLSLTRAAAATLQLGAADVSTGAVAQTLQVQSNTGATTTGPNFTIKGSAGTTAGGSIIFQTAATTTYAAALTLAANKTATFGGAIKLSTSSAPTGAGIYSIDGSAINFVSAGVFAGYLDNGTPAFAVSNGYGIGWAASAVQAPTVALYRDGNDTLALKRSTNPQIFRAYSTTTGPSYGYFASGVTDAGVATADTLFIGTGGAGAAMTKLALVVNGTTQADYNITNSSSWTFKQTVYLANSTGLNAGQSNIANSGTSNYIGTIGSFWFRGAGDGVVELCGASLTGSGFGRVMFGGTTSSFPALKRISSGNCLQVIAADNTASAGFIVGNQALATTATDGFIYVPTCAGTPTGAPTTQTGTAPIIVDTTNNKLYFYSGGQWRDAGP